MNFDDLKEQLLSLFRRIAERIQDTPAYGQLKDRFDGLSPSMQRLTVFAGVVLAFLIVLSIPLSWHGESKTAMDDFDQRRNVIRELLKVSREAAEVPDIPTSPPVETLKGDVQARAKQANLLDEQIKSIETVSASGGLVPSDKSAGGLVVTLWKLNLRQLVDVGTQLSHISPSVKMTGVEIAANKEDGHYFDVIYRLTALAVPDLSSTDVGDTDAPAAGRKTPPRRGRGQ